MFKFITSKPLWVNIVTGIGLVIILILLFFGLLDWITGHGQYEKVPSVTNQNVDAARQTLKAKGFSVEVLDSVYENSVAGLSVVKQSPEADALVKHGRTIYLTINRAAPPQVEMPNLVGFSIRSAQMYLQSLGLKMGDTSYRPDIARNAVLEQRYNGDVIKLGTKIPVGSSISFVLGSGVGNGDMLVPDLIGLTLSAAKNRLQTFNLNIGSIVAMGDIKDSSNSFIVKQTPGVYSDGAAGAGEKTINRIRQGQVIDVYISAIAPVIDTTLTNPN